MDRLQTQQLYIGYGDTLIVKNLNLRIPTGKITALVGANGSGKSTILKTMARIMKPKAGAVLLDGKAIHSQSTKEVAKQLAILPQNPTAPEGLTVFELVGYGRFPHQKGFGSLTGRIGKSFAGPFRLRVWSPLPISPWISCPAGSVSGPGFAMALAQQTDILFLDEPTTYLDMAHQLEILQLLQHLNEAEKGTIVMVVHDLNHATRYAHHMVAIKAGTVVSEGSPQEVVTQDMLREVFGIEADILTDPRTGVPLCIPYGLAAKREKRTTMPTDEERMAEVIARELATVEQ